MNTNQIQDAIFHRASRSITCLPFKKEFYCEISKRGMSSSELVQKQDWQRFVFAPFGKDRAEQHFRWMMKLGILRKEVDGQGLTDRVRLTPLGYSVIKQWEKEIPRAGIREKMLENFRRHTVST